MNTNTQLTIIATQNTLLGGEELKLNVFGSANRPLFFGKEVCKLLDIKNHRNAIGSLKPEHRGVHTMDTLGGQQKVSMVTESGLYKLVFKSRKPIAEQFQDWVCDEVLPSIRRHGRYELEQKYDTERLEYKQEIEALNNEIKELEEANDELIDRVKELESLPKILRGKQERVKVSERLVELDIITKEQLKSLLTMRLDEDGQRCSFDVRRFELMRDLRSISKMISCEYKETYDKSPDMTTGRVNIYTRKDFEDFGDELIKFYFRVHDVNPDIYDGNYIPS